MEDSKKIQTVITDHLKKNTDIRLAFLFGSIATGQHSEASDIDLAILFQTEPDFYFLENIKNALSGFIKREIDIVVLNDASPVIKMQALKKGIPLIRKGKAYEEFFTRTVEEYADLKITRKEIEDNILKGRLYA
ncbi:MAG: nucleotidyltransferase domain-containing protein [Syntrophobacterales bacterium]|nr:nucleotidyltransferase domain-containing protein [Syntrophobacterales bacterium]